MKKIILNKVYDTRTAVRLGCAYDKSQHLHSLYRKRTGEFFLYHGYSDGEEVIEPLTYEAAFKWASENISEHDCKCIFGDAPNDKKVVISLNVKGSTQRRLKELATKQEISMSEVIDKLIAKIYENA